MFSSYLTLTTVLCALIIVSSLYIIRSAHIDATAKDLTNLAAALKGQITPLVIEKNPEKLDSFVKDLGKQIRTRITIMAPDGVVLSDSEENPIRMENHQTRVEMAQALEGNTGESLRLSGTLKQEMLYIATPVKKDNKILYVLRVSRFLREIAATTNRLVQKIVIVTLVMDVAGLFFFALLFARSVSQPVRKLSLALRKVAQQNFAIRVFLKTNDELRGLADSFNHMIAEMEELFSELSRQKEELNGIITSLQEGLLALDKEDRILIANASLREIAHENLEQGRHYWEVLREPKLIDLIREVRAGRRNASAEIEFSAGIFLCSATFLSFKEEITVIFHDITEIKKLEKIKTDFVLNVSHELRTPLTSIKGFIETLETTALNTENRHYLEIIKRNTDRLINVVNDLLVLSELEEKTSSLRVEAVNMKDLVDRVLKIFEPQIKAKGISFSFISDPDLPSVDGDPFKLEQVFINLLDNAIKYTEKGGISVELHRRDDKLAVIIEDTGAGIPQEHLSRIFERFYVVDKSRSKKLGGTGLGLSIVKHIILLHDAAIDVSSTPGVGTRFTVTFRARNT